MSRTRIRSVLGVLVAVCALLGLAGLVSGPAAGQTPTSDPYGSTVPPTEPPGDPTCLLDGTEVEAGATLFGTVSGLVAGAEVEILLGALGLQTVIADADGNAEFSLVVPEVIDGSLVAVGVTFTIVCGDGVDLDLDGEIDVLSASSDRPEQGGSGPGGAGGDGAESGSPGSGTGSGVLAEGASRPATDASSDRSGSGSGSGSGALARTGATVVPLVVLGLLAVAVGAFLRKRSRTRFAG